MSAKHICFWDGAGYGRHCWECHHAHDWEDDGSGWGPVATCDWARYTEDRGYPRASHFARRVSKWDSQDNSCSAIAGCPWYTYVPPKNRRKRS